MQASLHLRSGPLRLRLAQTLCCTRPTHCFIRLEDGRAVRMVSQAAPCAQHDAQEGKKLPCDEVAEKAARVRDLFAGLPRLPDLQVFQSQPEHYRCRCEFSLWHDGKDLHHCVFQHVPGVTQKQRTYVEQYPFACKAINAMMPVMIAQVKQLTVLRHKLFQVAYHCTLSGEGMVTLAYHKKLAEVEHDWRTAAQTLRQRVGCRKALQEAAGLQQLHIIGRAKGQQINIDHAYVVERQEIDGQTYTQKQPEGCFSQPNGDMCIHMVTWAKAAVRDSPGDCLELYCGSGNFTIPLAQHFGQVVATEDRAEQVSKAAVAAAHENVEANNVSNIFLARMSSEEFVEAWRNKTPKRRLQGLDWESLDLRTLVVDPPRAGLDAGTEELMAGFERIVYVSCNPETLVKNLQCVKHTHDIRSWAMFDQFPGTPHIECGVYLVRRSDTSAAIKQT